MTEEIEQTLAEFEAELGIKMDNKELYFEALTHRSYLNEATTRQYQHNERLEFLGDAILELCVTEYLFNTFPDNNEGDLTSFRAALVKTESLANTSKKLGLPKYIFMSKGEELSGGRNRRHILANVYESTLGAIYLDKGYSVAKEFVVTNLVSKLDEIINKNLHIDSKSKLQEISQELVKVTPVYEQIAEEGPDHQKTFTMSVLVDDHRFGEGKGKSKQEAEQNAARFALENWEEMYKKYKLSAKITH